MGNRETEGQKYDIFIVSDDVVGEKMAGPGIRAWELAKVLSHRFQVALARPDYSPASLPTSPENFPVFSYTVGKEKELVELVRASRATLIQGYILNKFPGLKKAAEVLIVDMYVPFILENIFIYQRKISRLQDREFIHRRDLRVFNELVVCADHFLCATEKQKDMLVGCLLALNRINPEVLDQSPALDDLISVVPFGLNEEEENPLPQGSQALRVAPAFASPLVRGGLFPIDPDDTLFLWGGVISNWFDPLTLIQAFHDALRQNPKMKLLFLSTTHPNPLLPKLDMAEEAVRLASSLGIEGTHVFFNRNWVGYGERGNYFRAADIGVSIHKIHFETRFSFRTRMLDYIKYELPILCTEGDFFAELVKNKKLGLVVPDGDQLALREALLFLASKPEERSEMRQRIREVKVEFSWERVSQPLIRFCEKALKGGIPRRNSRESVRDLVTLLQPRKEGFLRRLARHRLLWKWLQKIPSSAAVWLKKLFK